MQKRFNYLQHEGAVEEILKHKWIESQKLGRDIGFVTAAHDWIKKYGEAWQKAHNIHNSNTAKEQSLLAERRKYRRFKINMPIKIKAEDLEFDSQAIALNHIGIDFISGVSLVTDSLIEIIIPFKIKEQHTEVDVALRAKVAKSKPHKTSKDQKKQYLIFTEFELDAQQKILNNQSWLFN
jgi:hypothetical protein